MTGDALTVLTSFGIYATKRFTRTKAGEIKNRSYGNAAHFRVEMIPVADFAGLCDALTELAAHSYSFAIRGAPLPGTNFAHTRRLLHPDRKTKEPATFTAVPRHWFAIDIDHLAAPPLTDPATDPDGCIDYLIGKLPPELADMSCWWQFTSSQSLPGSEDTLSARLWYWSSEPLSDAELTRWATAANRNGKVIDPVLYRAVQAHYIAAPIFEGGMSDPLPQRCGVRQGLEDEAVLIIPPPDPKDPEAVSGEGYPVGRGVQAFLAEIGGGRGFRAPILSAIASYIAINGSKADCTDLKNAIRRAIDAADAGGRDADQLERYKSDEHLDELIGWVRDHHGDQPPKGFMPEPPPHLDEPPPAEPEESDVGEDENEDAGIGPLPAEFSTEALALQFSAAHRTDWRYVVLWGKWLQWAAVHWRAEDTLRAFDLARAICRHNSAIAAADPHCSDRLAREIASAGTVAGVERLARADRRHAMTFAQWNADRWVINQPNPGTLDLKSGKAYPHRREDYITKIAAIAADPDCPIPLWTAFLDRVTAGDKELQAHLRRVAGYCMTGVTTEHVLFFCYGSGANGKGVFLNTLLGIWNDYAAVASMETFIQTRYEQHSTDLAMLDGARLVVAQEVERGKAWAEAKVNRLTGGDPITARFMRQDFFTYVPQFKIIVAANHKPSLHSVNEATRRRFHLIPFTVTIPPDERDQQLAEKLKPEWPGILNWALEGCLEWQKIGLAPPSVVRAASEAYFAEEDTIARWIEECCITGRHQWGIGATLWESWAKWADANREFVGSRKRFAQELIDRGYPAEASQRVRGHRGLDLAPPPDPRD